MMTITVDRAFSLIARLEGYRNPDRALQRASSKLLRAAAEHPRGSRLLYWMSVAVTNHRVAVREEREEYKAMAVWRRDQAIRFAVGITD